MSRILISLIGEQPLAGVIPVPIYQPDEVILLQTGENDDQVQHARDALRKWQPHVTVTIHPGSMPLYRPSVARQFCLSLLQTLYDHEVMINISGGSKLTAMVATNAAHKHNIEVIYVRSAAEGTMIHWTPDNTINEEPFRVQIPLAVRFACYGLALWQKRLIHWTSRQLAAAKELAHFVAHRRNADTFYAIKELGKDPDRSLALPRAVNPSLDQLVRELRHCGIWHVEDTDTDYQVTPVDADMRSFLSGGWLEAYVTDVCRSLEPDELLNNVMIETQEAVDAAAVTGDEDGAMNELDVVCGKNEELLVISCKTCDGSHVNDALRTALYELDSVAGSTRAGSYCRRVLVTTCHRIAPRIYDQAEKCHITLVSGRELGRLREVLGRLLAA